METMYFVLGMLSIVGAIILATIVWGVVKINNLLKEVKTNEERISEVSRTFWETTHDTREESDRRFIELERSISSELGKNERDICSEFERRDRNLDSRFKDICDEIDHTRSYIDSRIDKVTGTLGAKQVIKG
jgi:hypothetical protein